MKFFILILFLSAVVIALITTPIRADILNVPGDFETIQGAVDNAADGDSVIVGPGIYRERVRVVRDPASLSIIGSLERNTIIDLEGIEEGHVNGIYPQYCDVTVENIVFRNIDFMGFASVRSHVIIRNCVFENIDRAISINQCSTAVIENCTIRNVRRAISFSNRCGSTIIRGNLIVDSDWGIDQSGRIPFTIINNTIVRVSVGIRLDGVDGQHILRNNIVTECSREGVLYTSAPQFGDIDEIVGENIDIAYNCFWNNEEDFFSSNAMFDFDGNGWVRSEAFNPQPATGMLYENPLFVNPDGDFHLQFDSPCIDTGDPEGEDPDGTRLDMGAFYFDQGNQDEDPPEIFVDPEVIDAVGSSEHVINIANSGERVLWWRTNVEVDWISCEPWHGDLGLDEDIDLFVTLNAEGLEPGIHEDILWIMSNDPDRREVQVQVTLQVEGRMIQVPLDEGWNMISINITPPVEFWEVEEGPDVVLMTEQLRIDEENHHILMMKDENGRFYAPEFGFNNIPFWNLRRGYQIKSDADIEAVWIGDPIPEDADIWLEEGWNIVAYLPSFQLSASQPDFYVISPIIDVVEIAKDVDGRFLSPRFDFSNMLPWCETQGYQVKVDEDVVLNYPPEREEDVIARIEETKQPERLPHFVRKDGTGENMSLLVLNDNLLNGELGVYTNGHLVGTGVILDGRCGIAVWGDDPITDEIDGALQDEKIDLVFADANGTKEVDFEIIEGDGFYHPDDFQAIQLVDAIESPNELKLVSLCPNPFNSSSTLTYEITSTGEISLCLIDIRGRHISDILSGEVKAGQHSVSVNGASLSSGIYFLELRSVDKTLKRKLTLIK